MLIVLYPIWRACPEPRFPLEHIERASVTLKDTPLELCWASSPKSNESSELGSKAMSSPERISHENRLVNLHHAGFDPIPVRRKPIPPRSNGAGILGVQPPGETRVEEGNVGDGDEEREEDDSFPPLKPLGKSYPSSRLRPPPKPNPKFPNLSKFLGYFRKSTSPQPPPRSYLQVAQSVSTPTKMPPMQSLSGGRDGFGAGCHSRGAGRFNAWGYTWQWTAGDRGDGNRGGGWDQCRGEEE